LQRIDAPVEVNVHGGVEVRVQVNADALRL